MPAPRKIRCVVNRVKRVGDRVYLLNLESERPLPRFLPGQFCHLALDEYDPSFPWPESRAFSIASGSDRLNELDLAYSVVGEFTLRMQEEVNAGTQVWVKLPYGEFTISQDNPVVLWAGGTGLSAFTAFLDGPNAEPTNVQLVYGVRAPCQIIFSDCIERAVQKGAEAFICCENKPDEVQFPSMHVIEGIIDPKIIWDRLKNPEQSLHYLSGPPAMIDALRTQLKQLGVCTENIFVDDWE